MKASKMSPPPVTPSPHRFVIKNERPPVRSTPLTQEQTHTPRPSTQFNSTPRFTFSSTPRPTASQTLPPPRFTPSTARFVTPARRTPKNHDAIDLSFDDELQDVHDSIETEDKGVDVKGYQSADLEDDHKLEEPSPKRRRLSTSSQTGLEEQDEGREGILTGEIENGNAENQSSSLPILSSPPAPRRPISTTAPRFLLSTPAPQSTPRDSLPTQTPTPFLKPPRFRPPDPSTTTQAQTDPLPEQFSPHRKGQKYVPGGLAAEIRNWLMNLESTIPETRGRKRDEEWVVKIVIDEVSGGSKEGMTMARGRQIHTIETYGEVGEMADTVGVVKVILAGEGTGNGLQKGSDVERGKTIGIKEPVWEVLVEGEKWGVGVDWKVLT